MERGRVALEKKINRLSSERSELHEQLADSQLYEESKKSQLQALLARQAAVEKELAELETDWLDASEQLENA